MDKLVPVEGYGHSDDLIGYWNENKNKFEPLNDKVIDNLLENHKKTFRSEPMVVRVSKALSREGKYITYCSFNDYDKDRIIANIDPSPFDGEKWWE